MIFVDYYYGVEGEGFLLPSGKLNVIGIGTANAIKNVLEGKLDLGEQYALMYTPSFSEDVFYASSLSISYFSDWSKRIDAMGNDESAWFAQKKGSHFEFYHPFGNASFFVGEGKAFYSGNFDKKTAQPIQRFTPTILTGTRLDEIVGSFEGLYLSQK